MQYKNVNSASSMNDDMGVKKKKKKGIINLPVNAHTTKQEGIFGGVIKQAPLSFSALLLPLRIQRKAYERVNASVTRSSRMLLFRFLLLSLLTALLLQAAQCKKSICKDSCCTFVEGFPVRLKTLRASYAMIREYYVSSFQMLSD